MNRYKNPEKFAIDYLIENEYKLKENSNNFAAQVVKIAIEALEKQMRENNEAIQLAAAALGRKGGSVKSEAKAKAARENGKKGGRPRKKERVKK